MKIGWIDYEDEPLGVPHSCVHVMFSDAGFPPAGEAPSAVAQDRPFVSAKGPKIMDAPAGLIRAEERQPKEGGPTRGACPESIEGLRQGPPTEKSVPPVGQPAGVRAENDQVSEIIKEA